MINVSDIILLLPILLINSLWIIGFYIACDCETDQRFTNSTTRVFVCTDDDSKMILWRFKVWCLNTFGQFYSKPICTCPPCMSSIHSLWYWFFMPINLHSLALYPLYVFALCGLNYLIVKKFEV